MQHTTFMKESSRRAKMPARKRGRKAGSIAAVQAASPSLPCDPSEAREPYLRDDGYTLELPKQQRNRPSYTAEVCLLVLPGTLLLHNLCYIKIKEFYFSHKSI